MEKVLAVLIALAIVVGCVFVIALNWAVEELKKQGYNCYLSDDEEQSEDNDKEDHK